MVERVKLTFLGTGSSIPTKDRNHTGILLSYRDENILIDCGEGIQRQFKLAEISPMKLTKILITHWHGDHILGIPGLLQTLAFNDYNKELEIYGPSGTKKYIQELLNVFAFFGKIKLKVHEIDKVGTFFNNGDFCLEAEKVHHGIPCNAYSFVKKSFLRIDKKKLRKYKISEGPHLKNLKSGKDIVYNGKKFSAKNLTYLEEGKKISFVMDTSKNKNIENFVKNSDLLVIESSFASELEDKAEAYKHLTSKQAAEIGKSGKVKKIILTHIGQRYDKNPRILLNEAKKVFKNVLVAKDLDVVEV